jgi:hypothetical protein
LAGQPRADGLVQRIRIDAGQHATNRRLGRWPEGTGQRVAAYAERGQHLAGRIRGPLADRGQRPRTRQYRAGRHGQHRAQRMPSATPLSRVGELGEVVKQAAALVGGQRGGRDRMGGSRDGG